MFNSHLFKTLFIFALIIGVGFLGFTLISNYQKIDSVSATAGQTK